MRPPCQPRRPAGTSGESLSARGRRDNGATGGLLRSLRGPRGGPRRRPGLPTLTLRGLGGAGRGLRGGVRACAAPTLPEDPARGVRLFGFHSGNLRTGSAPRTCRERGTFWLPASSPLRFLSRVPGPGRRGGVRAGPRRRDPVEDQGQLSPRSSGVALSNRCQVIRTNSCCPSSDGPPAWMAEARQRFSLFTKGWSGETSRCRV